MAAAKIYIGAFDAGGYFSPSRRDTTPNRLFAWKPGLGWSKDLDQCAADGVTLMLDSGAYTFDAERRRLSGTSSLWRQRNQQRLEEHTRFVERHGARFELCAALDVIGDPGLTLANFEWQRSRVPMVFPTWHVSSSLDALDELLALNLSRLGIGGMARSHVRALPIVHEAFDRLCDAEGVPRVRMHGFGAASGPMLKSFPWSSVDATTATVAAKGRRLLFFDTFGNTQQLTLRETPDGEPLVLLNQRPLAPHELKAVEERLREHELSLEDVVGERELRLDHNARELMRAEAVIPTRYTRPRGVFDRGLRRR